MAHRMPIADNVVINNRDPNKPVLKLDIHVAQIGDQSNYKNVPQMLAAILPKVGMALEPTRNIRATDVHFVEAN